MRELSRRLRRDQPPLHHRQWPGARSAGSTAPACRNERAEGTAVQRLDAVAAAATMRLTWWYLPSVSVSRRPCVPSASQAAARTGAGSSSSTTPARGAASWPASTDACSAPRRPLGTWCLGEVRRWISAPSSVSSKAGRWCLRQAGPPAARRRVRSGAGSRPSTLGWCLGFCALCSRPALQHHQRLLAVGQRAGPARRNSRPSGRPRARGRRRPSPARLTKPAA